MRLPPRQTGLLAVLVGTVLWSTAGLFVRMADLDIWSLVAWRSFFAAVTLGGFWALMSPSRASSIGATMTWPGAVAVAIGIVSGFSYVAALQLTSVANVMTVYAALPFIATAIAFAVLSERVTRRFVVAGLFAAAGVAVMSRAAVSVQDGFGIAAALVMTTGFAASIVQAKLHPGLDMTLVTVVSAAASTLLALPLVAEALPAPTQLLACALLGILTTGLANVLVLVGGRRMNASEAGLISLLDVVLGPLWVWLAFDERVGPAALVGGSIVVVSVVWYLAGGRGGRVATVLRVP